MQFKAYRDCDQRLRLRKLVIELYDSEGNLLDRTRLFGGLWRLKARIRRRCHFMVVRAGKMLAGISR